MARFTLLQAQLATNLRRVHPTAIGLTLPSFFPRASRVAPKKKCFVGGVTSNTKLTNLVKACNRMIPPHPLQHQSCPSYAEGVDHPAPLPRHKGRSR